MKINNMEGFTRKLEKILGRAVSSKMKKKLLKEQILALLQVYCKDDVDDK